MNFLRDLRFAVRSLLRRPGFTVVAVVTLAFGLGVNAAVFSVVDSVVLEPLPFADPGRLVMLRTSLSASPNVPMSPLHLGALQQRSRSLETIAAMDLVSFHLPPGPSGAERLDGALVSPGFFAMLGRAPVLGRTFDDADFEPGEQQRPILLSHGLWQRSFGGDPNVLGHELDLIWNAGFGPDRRIGSSFVVVGVLPEDLLSPQGQPEVWAPLPLGPELAQMPFPYLFPFARLAEGVSVDAAREETSAIVRATTAETLITNEDQSDPELGVTMVPLVDRGMADVRAGLRVMTGAVVFVLLIACANVTLLLLARAAERRDELATRAALGASRRRLIGHLLSESVVLALAGGGLGLVLAHLGVEAVRALRPGALPRIDSLALDGTAVAFAFGLALVSALLAGIAPAVGSTRMGRGWRRDTSPFRGGLVMAEVALATALVLCAGLLWRSFDHLQDTDLGLDPEVLSFQMSLPVHAYPERAERADFYRRVLDEVSALPGVEGAAAISSLPLTLVNTATAFEIEGQTDDGTRHTAAYRHVLSVTGGDDSDSSGGYFRIAGISLRRGRLLEPSDAIGTPEQPGVALVNEALAQRVSNVLPAADVLSAGDLVGRRLELSTLGLSGVEIVGVVADVRQAGPIRDVRPTIYLPGLDSGSAGFVVDSMRDAASLAPEIRAAIAVLDPAQPVHAVATLGELASPWIARPRFHAALMGLFALLSLALATLGVYGVLSHAVARRRREIGVRMALGAGPSRIFAQVVATGLRPVILGLVAGAAGALGLGRFLESLLFGVDAYDPETFASTALVLLAAAGLAAAVPARRALSLDPAAALRDD